MATEVSFAKSFLSLLDSKPSKISPDHVEDPRTYPGSTPYILPRLPSSKRFSKPARRGSGASTTDIPAGAGGAKKNPGAEPATAVTLRSARNPAFDVALPAVPVSTSLAALKERVAEETGLPLDKIKLLFHKKPVADSKVVKDLLGGGGDDDKSGLELGVMVLGGGSVTLKKKDTAPAQEAGQEEVAAAPVAQGLSGKGVLETEQFWEDLRGYLQQRVRDEGVAGEALEVFRGAWGGRA
ncbi:hypothetical protein VTI74DRAFT_10396 [Chaetomium olivicolor]